MYIIKHRSRRINGPTYYYTVAGGANFPTVEQAVDCLFELANGVMLRGGQTLHAGM